MSSEGDLREHQRVLSIIAGKVNRAVGYVLITMMSAMVLDVTWQVFSRFVLASPSQFTEELAGFLLVWIGLLGAASAFFTRSHLGIDVLTRKLRGTSRRTVEVLVNSLVAAFAILVMVIGGLRLVRLTFTLEQISPDLGLAMGYVYLVLPISGTLIAGYALVFAVQALGPRR